MIGDPADETADLAAPRGGRTERFARWLVAWRAVLALGALAAVLALGAGIRTLHFESDYRIFFDQSDPQLVAYEALQQEYTRTDNLTFIVRARGGTVFSRATLVVLEELTDAAWKLPYATRVDSLASYQHSRSDGETIFVAPLYQEARSLTETEIDEVRRIALSRPELVNLQVSAWGDVTAVDVRAHFPDEQRAEEQATAELVAAARSLRDEVAAKHPDLDVRLLGETMITTAFLEAAGRDYAVLVPTMFGVVLIVLWCFFRSAAATGATLAVIAGSVVGTLGLAGWVGIALNQVSVVAPTIVLTLAVSDATHLLVTHIEALRRGDAPPAAFTVSLRINLRAVLLTSFTTAIGFLSLNFSDSPPFRELGTIVAAGVAIALALSLAALPWLAIRFVVPQPGFRPTLDLGTERLAEFVIHHRNRVLWAGGAITCGLLALVPLNEINDRTITYFRESTEFRQAAEMMERHLTGFDYIAYSIGSGEPGGISDPDYLERVDAFVAWLRQQPGVVQVASFTDTLRRLHRNLHGDDPSQEILPESRELAAQLILLYELSLPYGLDLASQIDTHKSALRVQARIRGLERRQLLTLEDRAQTWLAGNAPQLRATGAGVSLMFAHIGLRNIESMLRGAVVAILFVSLALVVALGSIRYGLLSLVPNAVPAGMALGLWALVHGQVNLAVAAVFSISLGIIVDDTVHFLSKYLLAKGSGTKSPARCVRFAYSTVGPALVVTTVALVSGFLVLATSTFEVNASMGLLVAVTLTIALGFDLLVLPALLLAVDREPGGREPGGRLR